eukprot:scaffold155336_cov26-Tisochrysis_lutea.AAC.1
MLYLNHNHATPAPTPHPLCHPMCHTDVLLPQDKLLEQGHLLDGVNGSLDRPVKGFNEAGKAQQLEGFKPPWGRLSWLGGLSLWVAFTQLIANKYVECGSPSYWCVSAQPCRCGWESVRSHVD